MKMPLPLIIFSQSDDLILIVAINSHTQWQTVQIQISWLLKKDLHCLQRQGIYGFSRIFQWGQITPCPTTVPYGEIFFYHYTNPGTTSTNLIVSHIKLMRSARNQYYKITVENLTTNVWLGSKSRCKISVVQFV